MPSHLLRFIYFHVVLTSFNNHILLFVSLSDFNSRFYNHYPISIRYFIISNVSLSLGSVSICSSPNEKCSRDLTPEIRPLLHAGQTSPLQPHPEQETCCSSCVSLNSWGAESKTIGGGFYYLCILKFFSQMFNNKYLLLLFTVFKDGIFITDILGFLL